MKLFAARSRLVDQAQELQPLLMAMLGHAVGDHFAVQNVERRKQCGSAVAFVVMGHGPGPTLLQGQSRLGAIKRLYLALFVN